MIFQQKKVFPFTSKISFSSRFLTRLKVYLWGKRLYPLNHICLVLTSFQGFPTLKSSVYVCVCVAPPTAQTKFSFSTVHQFKSTYKLREILLPYRLKSLTQLNSLTLQTIWNTVGFRTKFLRALDSIRFFVLGFWFSISEKNVYYYMCVFVCLRGFDLCCVDRLLHCRLTSRFTSVSSAKI